MLWRVLIAACFSGEFLLSNHATSDALLSFILSSLSSHKAEDVISISLLGKSSIADYMVIASGRSSRQILSLASNLEHDLKGFIDFPLAVEGTRMGDWVLVDVGDVIVHLFRPEVRSFYQLERMWLDAEPESGGESLLESSTESKDATVI